MFFFLPLMTFLLTKWSQVVPQGHHPASAERVPNPWPVHPRSLHPLRVPPLAFAPVLSTAQPEEGPRGAGSAKRGPQDLFLTPLCFESVSQFLQNCQTGPLDSPSLKASNLFTIFPERMGVGRSATGRLPGTHEYVVLTHGVTQSQEVSSGRHPTLSLLQEASLPLGLLGLTTRRACMRICTCANVCVSGCVIYIYN